MPLLRPKTTWRDWYNPIRGLSVARIVSMEAATGAGDPIFDDLARVWPRIEPVKFTNQRKVELIQRLIVAIEQRQVNWPQAWEVLTDELKRYEYAISPAGALTYSAPSGFHDDCVIALALAVSRVHPAQHVGLMASFTSTSAPVSMRCTSRVLP